jgi:uncharacterized membrane protein
LSEVETRTGPKARNDSLSDLIFGLALSVGAITLVSNVNTITTTQDLVGKIAVFAFSFLILISVWMRYSKIMSLMPLENRWTVSLHTALLFTVSLEPFLLNVLNLGYAGIKDAASQLYAIDLGVMMAIMGGFTFLLADEERNLIPKNSIREFKIHGVMLFVAATVFFVSISEIFWIPGPNGWYWRYYIWFIPLAMGFIERTVVGRSQKIVGETA